MSSSSGRNSYGRFTVGNKGGPGNPYAKRVAAIHAAFLHTVKDKDIAEIVEGIVSKAKAGDLSAAAILFDRVLGKPARFDPETVEVEVVENRAPNEMDKIDLSKLSCEQLEALARGLKIFRAELNQEGAEQACTNAISYHGESSKAV